jgi:DNA invertase Pin-like site-specific DNA recombinase
MIYGYTCLTSDDEDLYLQRRELRTAGCCTIFEDRTSGCARARLRLRQALEICQKGDVLVVRRFECLGRSPAHAIEILHNLMQRGIGLRSLADAIDTGKSSADLAVRIVGAIADFQRCHMASRDRRRLAPVGAPKTARPLPPVNDRFKLSPDDIAFAEQLIGSGERRKTVATHLGVGRSTLYRSLARGQRQKILPKRRSD